MIQRKLRGDPSLLDAVREVSAAPPDITRWFAAAFCWDHYGLPNGKRNPTSKPKQWAVSGHALMTPPSKDINEAFDDLVKPVLERKDRWAVSIPRGFGYLSTLDARVLVSTDNTAAMVLPMGIFGMQYVLNEIVLELRTNDGAQLEPRWRKFIRSRFPEVLAYLLLQKPVNEPGFGVFVMQLDKLRYQRTPEKRAFLWSSTVAQQLFVLLHELGHLVVGTPKAQEPLSEHIAEWRFGGSDEEVLADRWAARQLRRGARLSNNWPRDRTMQVSVLSVFGAIELLRKGGYLLEPSRDELISRLSVVLAELAGADESAVLPRSSAEKMLTMAEEMFLATSPDRARVQGTPSREFKVSTLVLDQPIVKKQAKSSIWDRLRFWFQRIKRTRQ